MKFIKVPGSFVVAIAAMMAFAAGASATTVSSTTGGPAETPAIHAVNQTGHVIISNPIANISCSATFEAKVEAHGGEAVEGKLYLTPVHRLYKFLARHTRSRQMDNYPDWSIYRQNKVGQNKIHNDTFRCQLYLCSRRNRSGNRCRRKPRHTGNQRQHSDQRIGKQRPLRYRQRNRVGQLRDDSAAVDQSVAVQS